MDESKLRYFISVVQNKSFEKAAQEHHVVRSTISRQIAALEKELGSPLFYRDPHKVELTPAGKRLYSASHGYMRQFSYINENVHNLMNQQEHRLMIGGGPYEFALIRDLVARYQQIDPDIELSQIYNAYAFIARNLRQSDARLYVAPRAVAEELSDCETISLGTHRWAAVTRRDSDFWNLPPEQQAVLSGQKIVRSSNKEFDPVNLWLEKHPLKNSGLSLAIAYTMTCSQAMLGRVALMPEYLEPWLPRDLRMEQVFPDPLNVESVLIFYRERSSPLEQQFFDFIKQQYEQ